MLSKQDTAFYYTNKAYKIYQQIVNKKGESETLNSLGHLSLLEGDFLTSALNVKKAINIQVTLNDKETLPASYNNLGYVYLIKNDITACKSLYNEALRLKKKQNGIAFKEKFMMF